MGKVKCFEELEVFQKARELCKEIYKVTNIDPFLSATIVLSNRLGRQHGLSWITLQRGLNETEIKNL